LARADGQRRFALLAAGVRERHHAAGAAAGAMIASKLNRGGASDAVDRIVLRRSSLPEADRGSKIPAS